MEDRFVQLAKAFLQTPPLWTRSQFGLEQFRMPEIDLSRVEPIPFGSRMRLGHKMERIFLALFRGQDAYDMVLQNTVVKREKKTLGEIDFLLRDVRRDRFLHLELTYKFYLIDTDISEPIYQLVGPNRRDMFYTKLDKLKEGQFSLPFTPEGSALFRSLDMDPEQLKQEVCFKAQLFKPKGDSRIGIRPLNKGCIAGYWMRLEDFESEGYQGQLYYFPSKEEWVLTPYQVTSWMTYYDTLLELNLRMIQKNSTLVWMKRREGALEKFFVVWW